MPWMIVYVALAVAGLAVLGVLAVRVFGEVRLLAAQVQSSSESIARAAGQLEEAARPLAARSPAGRG